MPNNTIHQQATTRTYTCTRHCTTTTMKQQLAASLGLKCFWLFVLTVIPSLRVSGFASLNRPLRPERQHWTMRSGSDGGSSDSPSDNETVDAVCSSSSISSSTWNNAYPDNHSVATTPQWSRRLEPTMSKPPPVAHSRRDVMQQIWRGSVIASAAFLVGSTTTTLSPPAAWARGLVQFPCVIPLANSYHFLRAGTTLLEEEGTDLCVCVYLLGVRL
jgi:hypothetical protein